jgi:hypothetical protein
MKIRLLLALVGLAISFALSTFAQQTNTPDPQLRQQLLELAKNLKMHGTTTMPPLWLRSSRLTRF